MSQSRRLLTSAFLQKLNVQVEDSDVTLGEA